MLADAVSIGGPADLQPWGRVEVRQNLRNLINSVNFDVIEVVGSSINVTGSVPFEDPDSVEIYGAQGFRGGRQPFGALSVEDLSELARTFVEQYAFGITERGFRLRLDSDSIASIMGDGTDLSGFYPGRPMFIIGPGGNAELGRVSRVNVRSYATLLIAEVETDSYVSSELVFIPSSFTREVETGAVYSINIPSAVGGVAPITYALQSGPSHAMFDAGTRVVSGTAPNQSVIQDVVIQAADASPPVLNGAITEIGNGDMPTNALQGCGMAMVNGTLYVAIIRDTGSTQAVGIYTSNTSTGDLTFLRNTTLVTGNWTGAGMAYDGTDLHLALLNSSNDRLYLHQVDLTDHSLSTGATVSLPFTNPIGVGLDYYEGTMYAGISDATTDVFYLYDMETSPISLSLLGTALPGAELIGVGMAHFGNRLLAGFTRELTGNDYLFGLYQVGRTSGNVALLGALVDLAADTAQWRGIGMAADDDDVYIGIVGKWRRFPSFYC